MVNLSKTFIITICAFQNQIILKFKDPIKSQDPFMQQTFKGAAWI